MSTPPTQQPPATPAAAPPTKQLTVPERQRLTLRRLFDQQKPELAKLMPQGMSDERIFRMALTECVKNPKLLECSAESWALALQVCAAQGLYPDSGLGYMYLIPRNNSKKQGDRWIKVMEVTAQRGYQGDIQLARNTGEVADIYAEVVYEKDEYRVVKGLDRNIIHVPFDGDEDPGKLRACYAVAKLKSGETAWVTLSRRDVDRHKQSAMDADNAKSPWKLHEAAMWKKTAIHELSKWLPKSSENSERIARAIATDGDPRHQQVIEVAAIDMGKVELPAAGETRGGLEGLTDRLASTDRPPQDPPEEAGAPAAGATDEPKPCPSNCAAVPKSIPPGKTFVCVDCGTEYAGEPLPAEREPGSDDGEPEPGPREAVQAVAAAAGAQGQRRQPAGFAPAGAPRQSRLKE